jgi:hypothetical protein
LRTENRFSALTAYGAEIPKAFATRRDALTWAEHYGDQYPGCRVVQATARGPRTIWRWTPETAVAA